MIANFAWCDFEIAQQYGLSAKHVNFLAGIAKGMQGVEIAAAMGMTHDGVRTGMKRMFRKMHVHDRAAAIAKAYDVGILRPRLVRIALAEEFQQAMQAAS